MSQNSISIVNTGFSYDIFRDNGLRLCSFPTKRMAERRLVELSEEFNLPIKSVAESDSRGIRNNNPANIRRSSSRWLGLADDGDLSIPYDKEFCQFKVTLYGVRAFLVLLRTYVTKHNVRSIRSFVHRFCPNGDGLNNESDYRMYLVTYLNRTLGLGILDTDCIFDDFCFRKRVSDPSYVQDVLFHFTAAVMKLESGFVLSSDLFNGAYKMM